MHDWQSMSHVRWDCKYHVVFVPKYGWLRMKEAQTAVFVAGFRLRRAPAGQVGVPWRRVRHCGRPISEGTHARQPTEPRIDSNEHGLPLQSPDNTVNERVHSLDTDPFEKERGRDAWFNHCDAAGGACGRDPERWLSVGSGLVDEVRRSCACHGRIAGCERTLLRIAWLPAGAFGTLRRTTVTR